MYLELKETRFFIGSDDTDFNKRRDKGIDKKLGSILRQAEVCVEINPCQKWRSIHTENEKDFALPFILLI